MVLKYHLHSTSTMQHIHYNHVLLPTVYILRSMVAILFIADGPKSIESVLDVVRYPTSNLKWIGDTVRKTSRPYYILRLIFLHIYHIKLCHFDALYKTLESSTTPSYHFIGTFLTISQKTTSNVNTGSSPILGFMAISE